MTDIDRALRQRERIANYRHEGTPPVPVEETALDRNVNRAAQQVREDGIARYVFYGPDGSGLVYRSKVPPPPEVAAFVVVDGIDYPRLVKR